MGERNWYGRYRAAKEYADEQAQAYERGDKISHWRYVKEHKVGEPEPPKETLTGASWVSWSYEIAAAEARSLVQVKGKHWQGLVDSCERLAQQYREKANKQTSVHLEKPWLPVQPGEEF
jgi:hypothetical protein